MNISPNLVISNLRDDYRSGRRTPADVMQWLLDRDAGDEHRVWIHRLRRDEVMEYVAALAPDALERLPLYGIPFVIKDNIDLRGIPTTAGCPAFAYTPQRSATVVQRLIDAGAIPLGKTNLDQFATGLVGTRSPYGACRNSIDPAFISGGSSSGSAVAVALGLASFALSTDTAGSGRVPAAFNNIIGLKPSLGRLSTRGVVPACRSLDCVSIFALTSQDAAAVLAAAESFDGEDAYSRRLPDARLHGLRVGIPRRAQWEFFGDTDCESLFVATLERIIALGGSLVEIDFAPFAAAARLLYDGPWVAERFAAVGSFIEANPAAIHPVTRKVIESGKRPSAVDAFEGTYALKALQRESEATWAAADLIVTPTAGTVYRVADVEADPVRLNTNLGHYTNYMNLFDLTGVAVPAGFRRDGLPFGITLVGARGTERALLEFAARLHPAAVATLGALDLPVPECPVRPGIAAGEVTIAVCGAHMQGLPLNHQLSERGGFLVEATSTAAHYRLFALPGGPPRRPGMIRVNEGGAEIPLEVWALPVETLGSFIAAIPSPLGVGKVELKSGDWVTGFLCESHAIVEAEDITAHGGWRNYLQKGR